MPGLTTIALVFVSAHLIAEFVPSGAARWGHEIASNRGAVVKHGFVHYGVAVLLAGFVQPALLLSWRYQFVALGLTGAHVLLHKIERSLGVKATALTLVLDQVVHFAASIAAAVLIAPAGATELHAWLYRARSHRDGLLGILAIYTVVIFGGGTFIRYVMRPLLTGLSEGEGPEQLEHAGMYIGWLERFLVITALVLQSPGTVGLILAAKSVVRFPELKSFRFAEYFLVGTLLSLSFAVAGGLLLAAALR
jgi:hypothetical protein